MGNKTQQPIQPQQPKSIQSSKITKLSIKHPKLSKSLLIQSSIQQQPSYLQLTQLIQSKQQYQKWKQGIKNYTIQSNQLQTILLPKVLEFEEKGLCGTSGVVKSKYLVVPFALKQQIENRKIIKQPFLEKQLWYLIYVLNAAGNFTHSKQLVLGDVRPQNILMSNDGEICVVCLHSFIDQQKNYYKTMYNNKITYLAPEQLQDLKQHKSTPTVNECVSQDFSIGLTILSAILLKDYSDLYTTTAQSTNIQSFNQSALNSQLAALRSSPISNSYSLPLRQITQCLLQTNPKDRLTSGEVIKILRQYEEQIINLDDFQVNMNKIDAVIQQKLGINNESKYKKVINSNDFNRNSRIQYSQSPRGSAVRGLENNQNLYGSNNYSIIRNEPQLSKQFKVANSHGINFQHNPINVSESHFIQHSTNYPAINVIAPPPQHILYQQNQQQRSIPLYGITQSQPPSYISSGRPENISIQQHSGIYGNSFVSSPEVANYISKINTSSFIPNQYNQAIKKQNINNSEKFVQQEYIQNNIKSNIPNQKSSNTKQSLYFEPAQQLKSNPSPNIYYNNNQKLNQNFLPFVPSASPTFQQRQIISNNTQFNSNHLTQPVRQSTAIRQFSDNLVVNKYDKSKDKIFQSYEQVMKNIDQTLRESKKQFPDFE